jgi:hypothetical protein
MRTRLSEIAILVLTLLCEAGCASDESIDDNVVLSGQTIEPEQEGSSPIPPPPQPETEYFDPCGRSSINQYKDPQTGHVFIIELPVPCVEDKPVDLINPPPIK